ncbi:hypothetical protein N658DRAFT_486762 [Parathielavia hyrcaniae]|uniref:Uncharacterized protein n=1 Tax=Parathielavia hyrcaniae TaxID=113614 RepID=A0AAN6Q1A8_9PEZI|nr:hypothetical protein N658DRAFT_486762 [Parathielavia hyrcaniae]
MADPDNQERRMKDLRRSWQTQLEAFIAEQEKVVDAGLAAALSALDASFTKRQEIMADIYTFISTTIDEHQAQALCGNRLDQRRLAEKHIEAASDAFSNYIRGFRAQHGVEDPSTTPGHTISAQDVETVSISSDTDYAPSHHGGADNVGDSRGVVTRNTTRAGRATTAYRLRLAGQGKRRHSPGPDTALAPGPAKRQKRTSLAGGPSRRVSSRRQMYSFGHSDSEETSNGTRTVDAVDVEGIDFIFRHPLLSEHGYYILRCGQGESVYHFQCDPFGDGRRAIKHFNLKYPKPKCHDRRHDGRIYGDGDTEEIVKRFGYRVVHIDGTNVDSGWVELSNAHLVEKNEKQKNKAKSLAKGKQKAPAEPRFKLMQARRAPVQRGFSAASTTPTVGLEAAEPSECTEPSAPSGFAGLHAGDAGDLDLSRQADDNDM